MGNYWADSSTAGYTNQQFTAPTGKETRLKKGKSVCSALTPQLSTPVPFQSQVLSWQFQVLIYRMRCHNSQINLTWGKPKGEEIKINSLLLNCNATTLKISIPPWSLCHKQDTGTAALRAPAGRDTAPVDSRCFSADIAVPSFQTNFVLSFQNRNFLSVCCFLDLSALPQLGLLHQLTQTDSHHFQARNCFSQVKTLFYLTFFTVLFKL